MLKWLKKNTLNLTPQKSSVWSKECEQLKNSGDNLLLQGKPEEASESYLKAIELSPEYAEIHLNLSNAWRELGKHEEALKSILHAIFLKPELVIAHFNLATLYIEQNHFIEATTSLRTALKFKPDFTEAYEVLLEIFQKQDETEEIIQCYKNIVTLNPDSPISHYNLAHTLKYNNQPEESIKHYKIAIKLDPDFVDAYRNLGNILFEKDNLEEAYHYYSKALQIYPNDYITHFSMGMLLHTQNNLDDSLVHYFKAITLKPDFAKAYSNIALIMMIQGKSDEAIAMYQKALSFQPDLIDALINLGSIYKDLRRFRQSLEYFQRAIEVDPKSAAAHVNLGILYKDDGKFEISRHHFLQAISNDASLKEAYLNLGTLFIKTGMPDDAKKCFQQAIEVAPDFAIAYLNLGCVFADQGNHLMAIENFRKALSFDPYLAEAYNNLADLLKVLGLLDNSIQNYRKALEIKPDNPVFFSNYLLCLQYSDSISAQEIHDEHLRFAQQFESQFAIRRHIHSNRPETGRRLKIAYISPDFRTHSVAHFIEPLLLHHNKKAFEIYCYYNNTIQDSVTDHIKSLADHWISCINLTDEELYENIRNNEIDILIDLAGHTGNNRLLTLIRKPAPIQVTYIGYPSSTGLSSIDYRISDSYVDPNTNEPCSSETIWHMPTTYCCFLPPTHSPAPSTLLPALRNGYVTFGCLNNFTKLTDKTLKLWSLLMNQLPDSKLILKVNGIENHEIRSEVKIKLSKLNLPLDRLTLIGQQKCNPYELYNQIDLTLDPFPYNGCTTSFDSLWMGVPFITLTGDRSLSRVGSSILSNIGMPELIANSEENYLEIVINISRDFSKLASIRNNLRSRLLNSPLTNYSELTLHLEQAYLKMWNKWCNNLH